MPEHYIKKLITLCFGIFIEINYNDCCDLNNIWQSAVKKLQQLFYWIEKYVSCYFFGAYYEVKFKHKFTKIMMEAI